MAGIEAFLSSASCFELRDEYLRQYGRVSPYIFRTPSPISASQLIAAGTKGAQLIVDRVVDRSIHVIGIASRGIPLATGTTISLHSRNVRDAYLSVVGIDSSTDHVCRGEKQSYTVVVDNAIVSGRTITRIMSLLRSIGVRVDLIVHLFNREEMSASGIDIVAQIQREVGCDIVSIFAVRDVMEALSDGYQRDRIVQYVRQYGNAAIRDYLERGLSQ